MGDKSEQTTSNAEIKMDPSGDEVLEDDVFLSDKDDAIVADLAHATGDIRRADKCNKSIRKDEQCGMGSWRPSCLQPCASLPAFTVVISGLGLVGAINFSYYTSVISQIEKQYGLSSSVTGFIKNVDNVGFLITVLIFSHFCRNVNKPRLFAITNVIAAFAIFCFSLPHFLFPVAEPLDDLPEQTLGNSSNKTYSKDRYAYCGGVSGGMDNVTCTKRSVHIGAFVILVLSGLLQGMARSPQATLSLTYMEDTAKDSSPKYFGFMFGSRALSPVLGFLLGAWTTTLYVDLSDPGITQADPRWVGAWWIGFLVCAVATVLWSFPLALFPAKIPVKTTSCRRQNSEAGDNKCDQNDNAKDSPLLEKNGSHSEKCDVIVRSTRGSSAPTIPDPESFMTNLKDMPHALCRLVRNPIFLFLIMGACCNMSLMGFITFLAKYIEMQFLQTTSMSNIYAGCISAFAWAVGPVVSGKVIAKFNISGHQSLILIVCIQIISLSGFTTMMLLGCDEGKWAGNPFQSSKLNLSLPCNVGCGCSEEEFTPVCGTDGFTYYSPCYAGCTGQSNATNTFEECICVPSSTATVGRCATDCYMLIPYLIVLGFTSFVSSMTVLPMMTVLLRCVEERDKSLSIALGTAFVNFAAFPAPIIYGLLVDSTCRVKQTSCDNDGACLYNNPTQMRYRMHSTEIGTKIIALVFFVIALIKARKHNFNEEHKDKKSIKRPSSHTWSSSF